MANVVMVRTDSSVDSFFTAGGSGDWPADLLRVKKCSYFVAVRNAGDHKGSAFFAGKISNVVSVPGTTFGQHSKERVKICFDLYLNINLPDVWSNARNPVRYATSEEIGLYVPENDSDWSVMPHARAASNVKLLERPGVKPLTIEEAKEGLAAKFGISPELITITIAA